MKAPDGHIFLESFSPVYKHAHDFLITISEVAEDFFEDSEKNFINLFLIPSKACVQTWTHTRIQAHFLLALCRRLSGPADSRHNWVFETSEQNIHSRKCAQFYKSTKD